MALMSESCMTDDAERNDREAADSGDHNLGYVLQQMGRSAEADRWLRRAGAPPSSTGAGL
jgi:hypothetical protein